MHSRRAVLAATALGLASAAGCLQQDGGGNEDDPQVGDATTALPGPLGVEDPSVAAVSDTDLAAIRESTGPLAEREDQVGRVLRRFGGAVDAVSIEDVDRVAGIVATDVESEAQFLAAVVEGSYDVDALTELLETDQLGLEARDRGSFTWFDVGTAAGGADYGGVGYGGAGGGGAGGGGAGGGEVDDGAGTGSAVLALSERRVLFAGVDSVGVDASELAGHVIDATTDDASPIDGLDDSLSSAFGAVSEHPDAAAAAVEPSVLGRGTGSGTEVPEALAGLSALGAGTTHRSDGVSLEAVLRFRSGDEADAGAVDSLVQSEVVERQDDPLIDAIEVEPGDGPVVRASADVDGDAYENSEMAELLVLPLPTIAGTFVFGFGSSSGGSAAGPQRLPQVVLEFEVLDDGRVRISHAGGDQIQRPLSIEYASDGEAAGQVWMHDEPIQAGDSYETEDPVDPGTELVVVWTGADRRVEIGSFTPSGQSGS